MSIILFGFKACGKTYFGKQLAHALNRPFVDTDDLIAGTSTVREVYQNLGETAFRALEKKVVLQLQPGKIIAVGGGTVLDPENVQFLQTIGKLVYLKASFEMVQKRIFAEGIPAFVDEKNPLESLRKIYEERILIYEKIPAEWIDTDGI